MAEAALMLCHRDPQSLTGRVTYSQELLAELGVAGPAGLAKRARESRRLGAGRLPPAHRALW